MVKEDDKEMIPALPRYVSVAVRQAAQSHLNSSLMLPTGLIHNLGNYLVMWSVAYLTSTSDGGRHDALRRLTIAVDAAKEQGAI